MLNKLSYKVLEDNGGGLHLFIFEDKNGDGNEKVIYEHSGYEKIKGQLSEDLQALDNGAHPGEWDGNEDNPEEDYEYFMKQESYNIAIVAACDYYGSTEIYIDQMGFSAKDEFGVVQND